MRIKNQNTAIIIPLAYELVDDVFFVNHYEQEVPLLCSYRYNLDKPLNGTEEVNFRMLKENPGLFSDFGSKIEQAKELGKEKWSASAIIQVIRWDQMVNYSMDGVKINDHVAATLARIWLEVDYINHIEDPHNKHYPWKPYFSLRTIENETWDMLLKLAA